ncbi:MAG: hypothetical protein J7515_20845 [Caulobacter sp.]|nr:hypothetical protein [Caulobacter sp.]
MSNAKAASVERPIAADREPMDAGVAATEKMKSHSLIPISHCYISFVPTPGELGVSIILAFAIAGAWIGARRLARRRKKARTGRA